MSKATITVYLTQDAQKAQALAGKNAAKKQTFEVPQENIPALLALPHASVEDDGRITYEADYFVVDEALPHEQRADLLLAQCPESGPHAIEGVAHAAELIRKKLTANRIKDSQDRAERYLAGGTTGLSETELKWAGPDYQARIATEKARRVQLEKEAEQAKYERQSAFIESLVKDPTPALDSKGRWKSDYLEGLEGGHGDGYRLPDDLSARIRSIRDAYLAALDAKEALLEKERAAALQHLVAARGTASQQARFAENLLPEEELMTLVRDTVFAPLKDWPRYKRLTQDDLVHEEACYEGESAEFEVSEPESLDAETYEKHARLKALAVEIPSAKIVRRVHEVSCSECGAKLARHSALISVEWYGQSLSREYAI